MIPLEILAATAETMKTVNIKIFGNLIGVAHVPLENPIEQSNASHVTKEERKIMYAIFMAAEATLLPP